MSKRVAIYARVSTLKGQDVDLQLRELRELAQRMGWQATEFVDKSTFCRDLSRWTAAIEEWGTLRAVA